VGTGVGGVCFLKALAFLGQAGLDLLTPEHRGVAPPLGGKLSCPERFLDARADADSNAPLSHHFLESLTLLDDLRQAAGWHCDHTFGPRQNDYRAAKPLRP
jgi:hypothetical protein